MTDEDVIRRRLLIDGDGTGDDRRLNILLKSFIKWANTPGHTPEDDIQLYRMQGQLSQSKLALTKSRLGSSTSSKELENYEALSGKIEQRLEQAKRDIAAAKKAFSRAKEVRKNRVQYDVLANIISAQPDRKQTLGKLDQIKTELGALEDKRRHLEQTLELRRKQFHVLITAVHDLSEDLDDPQASGAIAEAQEALDISLEPFDLEEEDEQAMNQD